MRPADNGAGSAAAWRPRRLLPFRPRPAPPGIFHPSHFRISFRRVAAAAGLTARTGISSQEGIDVIEA